MTSHEGPPQSSGAPLFGDLLKSYRQREHLSQRKAARILGVDESTIAKIEAGSRKPPIKVGFYERLKGLPGVTDVEIDMLLKSPNAPKLLAVEENLYKEETSPKFSVARVGDLRAVISLESPTFPPQDLDDIREIVARTVTLTLRDVIRRKRQLNPEAVTQPTTPQPPQSNPR